jgi:hypothetical protein
VQQVLALALETAGAVGHYALTLGGTDLAAQVGLAGLAELALLAFGGAIIKDVWLAFIGLSRIWAARTGTAY